MSSEWRCPLNRGVPEEKFHCIYLSIMWKKRMVSPRCSGQETKILNQKYIMQYNNMYDEVLLTTNDILRPFKRTMVEIGTCCISRNLVLANILVLLQKTLRFWENNGLYAHETFGSNIGCHLFKEVVRRLRITGWRPLRPLLTSCFAFFERFYGSLAWSLHIGCKQASA